MPRKKRSGISHTVQNTENFLKMFYLIFGQAYSRNYLSVDDYNRLYYSMPKGEEKEGAVLN